MKLRVIAAVALAASAACSQARPATVPTPAAFPDSFSFVATSPADSAMQGTFEGTATYSGGWLTLTVPKVTITVPPGKAENWRNLTIKAFVASDFRLGDWKAPAESRPVNVFRFLNFGATNWAERRTLTLETPLSFVVPAPPGATAATSRLAFELEWVVVMGSYGDTDSRIAFSGPISAAPP
jgi:hypothetical protein